MEASSGFRGHDFDYDLRDASQKALRADIWTSLDQDTDIGGQKLFFPELKGRLGKNQETGGPSGEVGQTLEDASFQNLMRLVSVREGFLPDCPIDQLTLNSVDLWKGEELLDGDL